MSKRMSELWTMKGLTRNDSAFLRAPPVPRIESSGKNTMRSRQGDAAAQAGSREKDIERSGGHRYELILADPKQANSACEALPRPRNSRAIEQRPGSAGSLASAGGLGGPFEAPHVISRIYRAPRFPRPLRPCRRASRRSGRRG